MTFTAHLNDKAILEVQGTDTKDFLQNLISNDMNLVSEKRGLYAFLLSAQGKFLHDFFILQVNATTFLLEVAAERLDDLKRRLTMLKLRADVVVTERADLKVYAKWPLENTAGEFAVINGTSIHDGRDANLCLRIYTSAAPNEPNASTEDLRFYLADKGVATSHHDFLIDKTTLMEAGLDGQFAISWTKGCFVGQELTARMKYRGLVKRLLVPTAGEMPQDSPLYASGKAVGTMQSTRFAHVKRDAIDFEASAVETIEGERVNFVQPLWWSRAEATSTKL